MPGFGTTDRTYDNAVSLISCLGAEFMEVSIRDAVNVHFRDIGQDPQVHDVTYENCQARERTQILMDVANRQGSGDRNRRSVGTGSGMGSPTTGIICPCMALMHLCRKH